VLETFSFPIPLKAPLEEANVHLIKPGQEGKEFAEECPGSVAEPKAKAGNFCACSESLEVELAALGTHTSGVSGVFFSHEAKGEGGLDDSGSWAVTAP
jgi:hypothetical protein